MKKVIVLFTTAVVLFAGARLYADDAPKADKKPMCCMFMENNDLLTPEQKTKVKALHAECMKDHCSADSQAKFFKATKALLTPAQIATCKANCEKKGIKGCPICDEHAGHKH